MKNKIYLCFLALSMEAIAQQGPTNTAPNGPPNGNASNQFWSRAGNIGGLPNNSNNIFGTMWNSPVYHYTSGQQRMVLFGNTTSASTPFGGGLAIHLDPANPIPSPKSLLTIGTDYDATGVANSGWRPWMKVGTFNTDGSDFAYFGLKREGSLDRNDAIIAWGDDQTNPAFPNIFAPDYMRFIFSADKGTGTNAPNAQGNDGLEIARLSPTGHMGIGNFYNSPLYTLTKEPARQLEILSDKITSTANGNAILRLTHTQQNLTSLLTTGLYSEFEPRNNGDFIY